MRTAILIPGSAPQRHQDLMRDRLPSAEPDGTVPALAFLDNCPSTIDAQFTVVLDPVAAAPPPRFSGGGKWEAMHGAMGGW